MSYGIGVQRCVYVHICVLVPSFLSLNWIQNELRSSGGKSSDCVCLRIERMWDKIWGNVKEMMWWMAGGWWVIAFGVVCFYCVCLLHAWAFV